MQAGPHKDRSLKTNAHTMHSDKSTYIPKPQKVKLPWVSACFHDTANTEPAPNLTINQEN